LFQSSSFLQAVQTLLHPRRNAKLQALSKLHRHQLRSHSILLRHSHRRARQSRILRRAAVVVTRGRGATFQHEASIPTDDQLVAIGTPKAASVLKAWYHHHFFPVLSKHKQHQDYLQSRVDDREAPTLSRPCSSSLTCDRRRRRHRNRSHNHSIRNNRKETLSTRLGRR
jgi:hypothetical protein